MTDPAGSSSKSRLVRTSTFDGAEDIYDHAISLVDATAPNDSQASVASQSEPQSWRQLARNATQTSVRDQIARRKYVRWQQDRYDTKDGSTTNGEEQDVAQGNAQQPEPSTKQPVPKVIHPSQSDSLAVDFGQPASPETTRDGAKQKSKSHTKSKEKPKEEIALDVLYENQRGSFFCGIPLYSHSSLLNFDPAPWVNKDYKASPVNITNAQVPDPSWQWSWKHWYVDMDEDVDEDGWQYSFAFFGNFSWHGTHPWFHSFCRRRRWLRKRVKVQSHGSGKLQPSSMSAAHRLNTDYFTIHSKRDRSPSTLDGGPRTARPDSYMSFSTRTTADEEPERIDNIAALLRALRVATIDREKLKAFKQFVELGGDELAYLKDHMPEIMGYFVFQDSRRQLLEYLGKQAQQHRDKDEAGGKGKDDEESRRTTNLLDAVDAADAQIDNLEYWSDRKHILETAEDMELQEDDPLANVFDKPSTFPQPTADESPAGEIKGISKDAELGFERVKDSTYRGARLAAAAEGEEKTNGKGKEKEQNDPEKADSAVIPVGEENDDVAHDYTKLDFAANTS